MKPDHPDHESLQEDILNAITQTNSRLVLLTQTIAATVAIIRARGRLEPLELLESLTKMGHAMNACLDEATETMHTFLEKENE
ncbi:hypothetical protein [Actinotignum urinale]|uniref:hypothetical protein n=1 Tax=Actinotignum urinale TaxID=190146 RepID=UPI0003B4722D|nr:hypothetical protein [Actinotignum urinale]MDY5159545.1 hypothetical protein [Actinotignum urinale]